MGYTDKKYLCVCKSGYTGENCEKGKSDIITIYTTFLGSHLLKSYRNLTFQVLLFRQDSPAESFVLPYLLFSPLVL